MAESTPYRTSFDFPHPNRKTVAKYLREAKSGAERKVWRDLLNSSAFHKDKNKPVVEKSEKKDTAPKSKKK